MTEANKAMAKILAVAEALEDLALQIFELASNPPPKQFDKTWSVSFSPISGGRLHLKYPDGEVRIFDVWDYLKRHNRTKGMWAPIFNQEFFNSVTAIGGAMPAWSDELTICPSVIYRHSYPVLLIPHITSIK